MPRIAGHHTKRSVASSGVEVAAGRQAMALPMSAVPAARAAGFP